MLTFGITGRSGAGKSTAARMFESRGVKHIDADKLVHRLQQAGTPCTRELAERFGSGIIGEDGGVNRRALAPIVFSDAAAKADLERIVYKYLNITMEEAAREAEQSGARGLLIDAIRLIESGRSCPIVAVVAPEEVMLARIMARDGLSEREAKLRLAAQKPDRFYTEAADHVIVNDGDEAHVAAQVDKIAKALGL